MNKQLIIKLIILSFPLAIQAQQGKYSLPLNNSLKAESEGKGNTFGLNIDEKSKVEALIKDESARLKAIAGEKKSRLQNPLKPWQTAKLDTLHQHPHHKLPGKVGGQNQH